MRVPESVLLCDEGCAINGMRVPSPVSLRPSGLYRLQIVAAIDFVGVSPRCKDLPRPKYKVAGLLRGEASPIPPGLVP